MLDDHDCRTAIAHSAAQCELKHGHSHQHETGYDHPHLREHHASDKTSVHDGNDIDDDDSSSIASNNSFDAAAAMMMRGAFLRKLREIELEDEAAREADDTEATSSSMSSSSSSSLAGHCDDTLDYKSYLADQSYYDDYKHVNYKFIDYGAIVASDKSLVIEQDRTIGKGGFCWDPGFILGQHFLSMLPTIKKSDGNRINGILELGSGPGVAGLMAAQALPDVPVHLTDLPEVLPLLQRNVAALPNASASTLRWGTTPATSQSSLSPKYDVILGGDVVASIYSTSALIQTLRDMSHADTWIVISVRDRLASTIEPFEAEMRRLFQYVDRCAPQSDLKTPNVFIFVAHGKKEEGGDAQQQ